MIATLVPLATSSDEASADVAPGWIPLLIVLALGAFVAFLYFSMKKQLNKIDIPEGGVPTHQSDGPGDEPEDPAKP